MKYIAVFVILACLAFPVFAQNSAISQRINALSESMGTTVSRATATLADFNSQIKDDGDVKVFTTYLRKYNSLATALSESESKLNLLLRTNDRVVHITAERDNYENILKQLQSVKSDFDSHFRSSR
jgi:hypothetical protein